MQRWRLAAGATIASGALAAGMFAAFSFVARADTPGGNCNGSGSPLTCTEENETIPYPGTVTLVITTNPGNVDVAVQWTAICNGPSGTMTTQSPASGLSVTTSNSGTVSTSVTLGMTNASTCDVQATAKSALDVNTPSPDPSATSTPPPTPVTSLNLAIEYTQNASATATATTASPSPTPSATKSSTAPKVYNNQVHGFDGMCMDDKGNSSAKLAQVVIWLCNNKNPAQGWTFTKSELRIHGKCLKAKGAGKSGAKLILWTCGGGPNEIFTHRANGEFAVKVHGWKLCVNDPGFSTKNGKQLIVYKCKNTANQHWTKP